MKNNFYIKIIKMFWKKFVLQEIALAHQENE